MRSINLICGPICSGKTTYCKERMKGPIDSCIKVSNVVRRLSKAESRKDLQNTSNLDEQIAEELIHIIECGMLYHNNFYIDGIRQLSIIERLVENFKDNKHLRIEITWLEVPYKVREERYLQRIRTEDDNVSFEEANKRDNELGLSSIYKQYFNNKLTNEYNEIFCITTFI